MKKVVNITDRLTDKRRKQQVQATTDKIETIKKIIFCSLCQLKCAMCANHLGDNDSSCPHSSSLAGLNLCEDCSSEFEDFLEMAKGKKGPDTSWHNREWMKLWSTWLDYHRAIKEFRNSTEFKLLIKKLDD